MAPGAPGGAGGTGGGTGGSASGGSGGADAGPIVPGTRPPTPLRASRCSSTGFDNEGGAATLLVAPDGQTLLADAGWEGPRDPARIAAVLAKVGAKRIDYLLATHFHEDHAGGCRSWSSWCRP